LEELLLLESIRRADDGAGDALDVRQHPGADLFIIVCEIELADARPHLLVGWLMSKPMTSGLPLFLPLALLDVDRGSGISTSTSSGSSGFSALTSDAGLSSRRSLKAAWRRMPSSLQPANSTSATSSGFTQWTSFSPRGALAPVNGFSAV